MLDPNLKIFLRLFSHLSHDHHGLSLQHHVQDHPRVLISRLREEGLQRQRATARPGTSPEPASVLDADNEIVEGSGLPQIDFGSITEVTY